MEMNRKPVTFGDVRCHGSLMGMTVMVAAGKCYITGQYLATGSCQDNVVNRPPDSSISSRRDRDVGISQKKKGREYRMRRKGERN